VRGHVLVAQLFGKAVAHAPGAAVALDQRRKRPRAARAIDAREQRLVDVAQVFDVVDREVGALRLERRSVHGVFLGSLPGKIDEICRLVSMGRQEAWAGTCHMLEMMSPRSISLPISTR